MNKCLVIGLDGATWDIIKPLADAGTMPTIKKLMENGSWGELQSTIPPVTGPAWVSFATGMNPGKTGVFDFLNKKEGSYDVEPITSHDFKGIAIWDHLTKNGKRTCIVNYPMLFPPYPINGVMIAGLAIPDENITYPPTLRDKLDKITGGYELIVPLNDEKYDDIKLFFEDLNRVFEKRVKVVQELLKDDEWDLFITIFSATDWIQHVMWGHIDESYPLHNLELEDEYKAKFSRFWNKVDDAIGEIVKLAGRDMNIIIVSDHGFGPQYGCFNINKWLEKKRYIVRKRSHDMLINRVKTKLRPTLARWGRKDIARFVPLKVKESVIDSFLNVVTEQIDLEKSIAYTCGHTTNFGGIYLNVEGREPKGIVKEEEYGRIKEEIALALKNLKDDIGENVKVEIFDPADIYWGRFLNRAPDIIFSLDDWMCLVIENFEDGLFEKRSFSPRYTGAHRLNGLFLATGPSFKKRRKLKNAKIYDVAPTMLELLDLQIPWNIDGRVLKEILN